MNLQDFVIPDSWAKVAGLLIYCAFTFGMAWLRSRSDKTAKETAGVLALLLLGGAAMSYAGGAAGRALGGHPVEVQTAVSLGCTDCPRDCNCSGTTCKCGADRPASIAPMSLDDIPQSLNGQPPLLPDDIRIFPIVAR